MSFWHFKFFFQAAQSGTLQGKVTEKYLIDLLEQLSEKKQDTKITVLSFFYSKDFWGL